nr:unnamed protein product [Callosobruchus analis]
MASCTLSRYNLMADEEDLFLFAAVVEAEEQEKEAARKIRMRVHNINSKRKEFGEFHHLFPYLLRDRKKFTKYFRMTQEKSFELLHMIKPLIEKRTTKFR